MAAPWRPYVPPVRRSARRKLAHEAALPVVTVLATRRVEHVLLGDIRVGAHPVIDEPGAERGGGAARYRRRSRCSRGRGRALAEATRPPPCAPTLRVRSPSAATSRKRRRASETPRPARLGAGPGVESYVGEWIAEPLPDRRGGQRAVGRHHGLTRPTESPSMSRSTWPSSWCWNR